MGGKVSRYGTLYRYGSSFHEIGYGSSKTSNPSTKKQVIYNENLTFRSEPTKTGF